MAHLLRLIVCAFIALASWLPGTSDAGISWIKPVPSWMADSIRGCNGSWSPTFAPNGASIGSVESGVEDWLNGAGCSDNKYTFASTNCDPNTCTSTLLAYNCKSQKAPSSNCGTAVQATVVGSTDAKCSSEHATRVGLTNSCACDSGYTEVNGTCTVDSAVCKKAKGGTDLFTSSNYRPVGSTYCPSSGNASGCGATVTGGYATVKGGVKSWITEVTYGGTTCTPPAGDSANDTPTPCKGTVGKVNNVDVCIPFSATNPPAETVTSKTQTNPDNSTTTTTTDTTCDGSRCTTTSTTTTTNSDATSTTTSNSSDNQPQNSFCQDNPNSPMCKPGSFMAGNCSAAPTCDGDGIQCAIAAATYATNCALATNASDSSISAFQAAQGGTDSQSASALRDSAQSVSVGSFNYAGQGWSRTCPADPVIPLSFVASGSFTIPFSKLCSPLSILSTVAVAITALGCLVFCVRSPA